MIRHIQVCLDECAAKSTKNLAWPFLVANNSRPFVHRLLVRCVIHMSWLAWLRMLTNEWGLVVLDSLNVRKQQRPIRRLLRR